MLNVTACLDGTLMMADAPAETALASDAPTATLAQANATLAKFGRACRSAADANFVLAELAARYVEQLLGARPGKAERSNAVEKLAGEWLPHDEPTAGMAQEEAMKLLRGRVNLLIRCNAVVVLLGDGSGQAGGEKAGKGKKDTRLPWTTLREFCPLASRQEGEDREIWRVLPGVEAQARALVVEAAANGMTRQRVAAEVARLMLLDAEQELQAARHAYERTGATKDRQRLRRAKQAVERWEARSERKERQDDPPSAPVDPPPAPPAGKSRDNLLRSLAGAGKDITPEDLAAAVWRHSDDPLAMAHDVALTLLNTVPDDADFGQDDIAVALLLAINGCGECSSVIRQAAAAALNVAGTRLAG